MVSKQEVEGETTGFKIQNTHAGGAFGYDNTENNILSQTNVYAP